MILIADSGATSTHWRLIDSQGAINQFKTSGFNPYYQKSEDLSHQVSELAEEIESVVKTLYYYGAGCGAEQNRKLVKQILLEYYRSAGIYVEDDMLAAARALCGNAPGIACILGTGANSCYYNGENIEQQVASLGYVLGDEGSGAYLGKRLLADYLRDDMDAPVAERFKKRFNLSRDEVLDKVYYEAAPGRYMAGFTKFLLQNSKEPYCYSLVYKAFSEFFERNVLKYDAIGTTSVHFSGSVAYYFSNVLRQVATDKGVVLKNIIESPIAGLTLYHKNQHFQP
ncbi:MAG: N-acetylglucosamine kinase [Bacteroidota bacterium]